MVLRHLSGIREATITHAALNSGIGCYDFPGSVLQTATAAQPQKQAEYGTGFRDDGSDFLATATSIINNLERLSDWDTITESLRAVNRAVKNIDLSRPGLNRLEIALGLNGRLMRLDSSQESEGFRRFLAHMLALYQSPPKQTLIFEHPEHGIHPGAMTALFEEFEAYVNSGRGQIILTTHSPQLLDHFKPENIRVVEMVGQETQIGPLAPEQAEALRDDLLSTGELLTVDPARLKGQLAEVPG
jgi:predicted ATPase